MKVGIRPTNAGNQLSGDKIIETDNEKNEVSSNKIQEEKKEDKENIAQNNKNNEEEFIGKEEAESQEKNEQEGQQNSKDDKNQQELTGEEKAVDIITKKYAYDGQKVTFDHMEGKDFVIKINAGTAVTWYIVNGDTWEASEY